MNIKYFLFCPFCTSYLKKMYYTSLKLIYIIKEKKAIFINFKYQ